MFSLHRNSLLLAAALCVLAGNLAAQTQRVATEAAQRLRDEGITLRVGAAGVDTLTARTGNLRVRAGDMIVNVTGDRPTRVRPTRTTVSPTLVIPAGDSESPDATPVPRPDPVEPRPSREETAPTRPRRDTPTPTRPRREEPAPEPTKREESAPARPDPDPAPEEPAAPASPSAPIAYELGYEIGMGAPEGEHFHILVPIVEIEGGGLRYDPVQPGVRGHHPVRPGGPRHIPRRPSALPNMVRLQISGDAAEPGTRWSWSQINIPFRRSRCALQRPRGRLGAECAGPPPPLTPTAGSVISIPVLRNPVRRAARHRERHRGVRAGDQRADGADHPPASDTLPAGHSPPTAPSPAPARSKRRPTTAPCRASAPPAWGRTPSG